VGGWGLWVVGLGFAPTPPPPNPQSPIPNPQSPIKSEINILTEFKYFKLIFLKKYLFKQMNQMIKLIIIPNINMVLTIKKKY